jgi:sigma-B regulation protein RsbU (phosphoserine phosphatase)
LTFCNAGHNPPLVIGAGGLRRLESGSMPVGMFDFAHYHDAVDQLAAGDVLVIYSDGVTEALNVNGDEFGEERLVEIVTARKTEDAAAILNAIVHGVQGFARGAAQHDDVTAMVVKYTG